MSQGPRGRGRVIEQIPGGVVICDREGHRILSNGAARLMHHFSAGWFRLKPTSPLGFSGIGVTRKC